jgi:hypothetical protein
MRSFAWTRISVFHQCVIRLHIDRHLGRQQVHLFLKTKWWHESPDPHSQPVLLSIRNGEWNQKACEASHCSKAGLEFAIAFHIFG